MTEKEKSHAGMLYQPGDPELVADRDITVKKLYDYNNLHPLDRDARRAAIHGLLGNLNSIRLHTSQLHAKHAIGD